jgi:hypothetical protein
VQARRVEDQGECVSYVGKGVHGKHEDHRKKKSRLGRFEASLGAETTR